MAKTPKNRKPLRAPIRGPLGISDLAAMPRRKPVPHEFVLDALTAIAPRTHPMFGCLAVYVEDLNVEKNAADRNAGAQNAEEKIVLILRDKPGNPADNGVWLATTAEHHASLQHQFPNMRSIQVLGKKVTGWQVLPADSPDFEESALRACELVLQRDPRIGKVPARKRSRRTRRKVSKEKE